MNISNIQGRVILGVWAFALVLLGAPLLFAMSVDTVPDPRAEDGWVSDTIGLIEPERRLRLNQKLSALEQQTEVEVALVVVEAVDTATPKDFATQLFNHWKLGKASQNNGLLILLVHGEKRLEMETGYGLETVLTDGWLKRVQMREMVPAFKADRYGQGLEVGVDAVIQHLTDNLGALEHAAENPQRQAPRPPRSWCNERRRGSQSSPHKRMDKRYNWTAQRAAERATQQKIKRPPAGHRRRVRRGDRQSH
ncbi:TPM domain-containing protein [Bradymonas sediminis]|uniref:Uncharacterized protein n=1 Tax=Bradymonas sediminis TaxID=1548548 RepID=A0A2Z4FJN2_9DELT|nr:TPM domain-containing protein [Bradymonas sediminis]AWV89217.1 hypothetical protein DN745_07630 [Bradymonas sediminis]TDP73385.1 TLP18.3/Psb32/MOLO-1 phosphatase superfamily protein [Bradymonas sediminis]